MTRTLGTTYCTVADGIKSVMVMPQFATGNATQTLTEYATGYSGSCPMPARLDHSHPLNVTDSVSLVKAIGPTGKLGTSPYYARVDHVHAFVAPTGGTYKTFSSSMVSDNEHGQTLKIDTWNIGRDQPNGVQVKLITRETLVGEGWEQKHCFFFRNAQISNMGTIINIGAEEGCIVVAV